MVEDTPAEFLIWLFKAKSSINMCNQLAYNLSHHFLPHLCELSGVL